MIHSMIAGPLGKALVLGKCERKEAAVMNSEGLHVASICDATGMIGRREKEGCTTREMRCFVWSPVMETVMDRYTSDELIRDVPID